MFRIILICSGLTLLIFVNANATGLNNEHEFSLGFSLMDMNYKEFDDFNELLNREDGLLPGVTGQLLFPGARFDKILSGSFHSSTISYDGQTQSGIPVQTDTETNIVDAQFMVSEKSFENNRFYGGLGYRYWRRNIQPTVLNTGGVPQGVAGLLEDYDWFYALLGLKSEIINSDNSTITFDFRLTRMLKANMDIDFLGYANLDNKTVDLGRKTNFRIGLPWRLKTDDTHVWLIEPYFEQWDIGKSNVVNLTVDGVVVTGCPGPTDPCGVLEPRSETRNFGVNIQMVMAF